MLGVFTFIVPAFLHKKAGTQIDLQTKQLKSVVDIVIPAKDEAPTISQL